ncbi:uncharacterized protein LOC119077304 [Bradysia coprophila]|uniref:uncharacterized protein LOC119077304 n=1 Tax=Bradysia coprophila TaxID=38358 RepID=UPI00187DD0F3|nr:uncharacterized protein LOC119077304 [Bradysia coprophila]
MKSLFLLLCLICATKRSQCDPDPDIGSFFSSLFGAPQDTPIRSFGNGFWNVRVPFQIKLLEIGTHMSLIQLSNGNFLVIDTVALNDQLERELNELTNNGTKIEAVLAVHPFHTLAYSAFHRLYPNVPYYGTPRHLRKLTEIKWAGQLDDKENKELLSKWAPDVELRIPAGAEYFDPQPEDTNHFVSIFVYHRNSKTLHVDDTLIYAEDPSWPVRLVFGVQAGSLKFHPSMADGGLYRTVEAPLQFRDWMKKLLDDWDFENLCTAHIGVKKGGAHDAVRELVNESEKLFEELSERNRNN